MKNRFWLIQFVILLADTCIIWTLFLAFGLSGKTELSYWFFASIYYLVIVLSLYAFRGYDLTGTKSRAQVIISTFQGMEFAALITAFLIFFNHITLPIHIAVVLFCLLMTLFSLVRILVYEYVQRIVKPFKFIIVGSEEKWNSLAADISQAVQKKAIPVDFCDPDLESLSKSLEKHPFTAAVLVIDPAFILKPNARRRMSYLRRKGIRVNYVTHISELYLERVPLSVAKEFRSYYEISLNNSLPSYSKRAVDIVISSLGLIFLMPLAAIIAVWIIIEDGFPVIFRQERVGMHGEKFNMHKFRTMRKAKVSSAKPAFATQDAARIINPIGKILRRTRLDEILQLWDVLRGKMSLIGPRPEQPQFVEHFSDALPFYDYRHNVRPGITGWAQVNFSYAANLEETARKLEYDLFYVKNRTVLLDLIIVLRTIETMLGMRGAK